MSTTAAPTLQDRYGAPSPWRRRGLVAGVVVLAVVFGGWTAWTAWDHANPEVTSAQISYDVVDDHTATAVVRVEASDPSLRVSCLLRAYAEDHSTVGELRFEPDLAQGPTYDESVRTERMATNVELVGCTAPGQRAPG